MSKRTFLMLAHVFKGDENIGSWFCSEKLDGLRAWWDGGITRGIPCKQVPFANVEKDARYLQDPVATGLWSRYGKAIQAPSWWLDKLPVGLPLDGELYIGRSSFQSLTSIVKKIKPGAEWLQVTFKVFDTPPLRVVLANGEINETNYRKRFAGISYGQLRSFPPGRGDFASVHAFLRGEGIENDRVQVLPQSRLAVSSAAAREEVTSLLDEVVSGAGEGLMLRNPGSMWVPQRSKSLLKAKGMLDSEAEVVGYVFGRETDKGSKLLGLMGAMIVRWRGKIFELSGFTDEERSLCGGAYEYGCSHPGERVPDQFQNLTFPVGSQVTFKYRELTDGGVPKEARYLRKREEE